MKPLDLVRDHFDREAKRFDAIYGEEKPLHQRIVDRLFRRVVVERFKLVCNLAPSSGPWTALDVGCGSGRYAIALARGDAARVLGIDAAPAMIDLARQEASRAGLGERCRFEQVDFLSFSSDEKFDAVLAMGYFDYMEDPLPHLQKMIALCRGKIFASFPKRWEFRVPIRKARFALRRNFVRFYSRTKVDSLFREAGLPPDRSSLIDLGRDWIAVIRPA